MKTTHAAAGLLLGSLALTALAVGPARADQTIKIGIINSYSGFLAQPAEEMDKGFSLYVTEHEKDLPPGIHVELLKRDDTGDKPEIGKREAQELIVRDHVQFLAGLISSPIAAAIAPLTVEAKIPLVLMNAGGVALTRLSPYVVRTSFTQWETSLPLGKWAAENYGKTGYTAVADYIPGHDAEGAFIKGFTDAGGKILGSIRFPFNNPDFTPYVERVKDAHPKVAFLWPPAGTQAVAMMNITRDLKLREGGTQIVSTQDLVPDEELPAMGNIPLGLITAGNYSTAATRPANLAFLAAWKKAYGDKFTPDYISVGGWDGMAAIFAVIKETKGNFTGDQAMAILSHWKNPDSPRGPIEIDPATRDLIQNIYIRRTEMKDGKLANVEFVTIPQVKDPWKELNPPK